MQMVQFVTIVVVVLLAVTVHEVCHGLAAWRLGDDTAYHAGRLTLNPIAHIDLFGSLILPLLLYVGTQGHATFAYAKPVPVNPQAFRRDITMRSGMSIVAAAGPVSNILLAVLFAILYHVGYQIQSPYAHTFAALSKLAVIVNLNLAFFNFVPIPPLDGSKVLLPFLSNKAATLMFKLEAYGFFLILFLFYFTPLKEILMVMTSVALAVLLGRG